MSEPVSIVNVDELEWKTEEGEHYQSCYRVLSESGPDHAKVFTVLAMVGKRKLGLGEGKNKKEAEQAAAEKSLEILGFDLTNPTP